LKLLGLKFENGSINALYFKENSSKRNYNFFMAMRIQVTIIVSNIGIRHNLFANKILNTSYFLELNFYTNLLIK
jgi:hypothetical protein